MANKELEKIAIWFQCNKLTLNVSKTKYILFKKQDRKVDLSNYSLKIGNECIERIGHDCEEKSFKFLGHHIDENLSWEFHISHVKKKLATANYFINNTKNYIPIHIRKILYNSCFRPHMEFGILAWGGVSLSKVKCIINLQKKCIRNIAYKSYNSHTDPLFKCLEILKFQDLFKYNCSVFMYKYGHGLQPKSFANMFIPCNNNDRTGDYKLQLCKGSFLDKFPSVFMPRVWNYNSNNIKHAMSLGSLKSQIKTLYISHYNKYEKCSYPLCPDCN